MYSQDMLMITIIVMVPGTGRAIRFMFWAIRNLNPTCRILMGRNVLGMKQM